MNVCVIAEIVNYHSGARAPLQIAKHLAQLKNQVTVYAYATTSDQATIHDLQKNNVRLVLFSKTQIPIIGKYFNAFQLHRHLTTQRPQIILFAGTLPFFFAARLTTLPIVRMYMGTQFDAYLEKCFPKSANPLHKIINRFANFYIFLNELIVFRLVTQVVAISHYALREGEALYRRKVSRVIYLGTTQFSSPQKNKVNTPRKHDVLVLSVSRLTPYKGFHLLIEAIKLIKTKKRITLWIVGSQPKTNYIAYLKKIGGTNIRLIINPSDVQLEKLYQKCAVYLTADKYLYFGLPILEAAAYAKPTIAFNFAAAAELVINTKSGFVVNSITECASCLQTLIDNPTLRSRMGTHALKRVKKFTWQNTARQYQSLFQNLLAQYG